jgi:hypothetical protein
MNRVSVACVAALVLGASAAHADVLPPGVKGVRLSIHVDAEIPRDRALVLANTFRGADVLEPGSTAPVEWHPLGGAMQLMVIDARDVPKLTTARAALDRAPIKSITARGVACGAPFEGVRTVPETSPTSEIRWIYRVGLAGATCTAELLRTEEIAKADEQADAASATRAPPVSSAARVDEDADAASVTILPPSRATPPKGGCGACATGSGGDRGAAWAWLLGGVVFGRLARRTARPYRSFRQ